TSPPTLVSYLGLRMASIPPEMKMEASIGRAARRIRSMGPDLPDVGPRIRDVGGLVARLHDGPWWPAGVLDRRGDAIAQVDDHLLVRSGLCAARSGEAVAAHEQEQQHGGGDAARRLAHGPTEGDD